ncbi:MAG TPA: hypothetical protein VE969_06995 [Pyrinomonadaceae bacterium]|nr:hypothetical protein [Pyrinomonadaceae bacterium]
MAIGDLAKQIIALYERHGWTLKRALLTSETRAAIDDNLFDNAAIADSDFDALWFARPSYAERDAWELRLLAEQQYSLFEAFEADESEEDRDEARLEMENRMREFAKSKGD